MSELRGRLIESLTVRAIPFEAVGASAFVRPMTVAERRSFLADHNAREDKTADFAERLLIAGLCDADGTLLFGPDEAAVIADLDGRFVEDAAARLLELNRLGGDDPKAHAPSGATPN